MAKKNNDPAAKKRKGADVSTVRRQSTAAF